MEIKIKVLYSDFMDSDVKRQILEGLYNGLRRRGVSVEECEEEYSGLLILTGGTEQLAVDEVRQKVAGKIILYTHRGNNSLAAALEISAYWQQLRREVQIIDLEDDNFAVEMGESQEIQHKVQLISMGCRIGVIGEPSDWLIASSHSAEILRDTWGVELKEVSISYLQKLVKGFLAGAGSERVRDCAEQVKEPGEQDLINSEAVYKALQVIIAEHELDGLTVRCFDLVKEMSMTACYALGKLNADNIPAGCEGDIASITGIVWAQKLTGNIAWMANPVRIDKERGVLTLAHCTAPLNVLKEVVLRSHFESGLGVGIQGKLDFEDVTLFRLGGSNLDKIWIAEGKVIKHLAEENLCRTQIKVELDGAALQNLLGNPLGNHLLVLPGKEKKRMLNSLS
jgi:L-fucose isomerase-like protein